MSQPECIAEGRHLRLLRLGHWEYVERRDTSGIVAVVAVTDDGRIVLIEQFRAAVGRRCIELPAGLAGDSAEHRGEDLIAASRRELFEETGYEAERFEHLCAGPPSAGLSSEVITFYRAHGLRRAGVGGGDADERIIVHEIPLAQADDWLKREAAAGTLIDPKVYTGLYFAAPRVS
ncbi:MAG: NUDIX hydrolase [Phycisphaerae bacterium]|nr:NUDIX hydrolase [Phycisphaerae bacterium]MCZ2400587.1 NUDIX hydrolase [Phycisphaerae bacterium]NUQ48691.1 NUDIX hydrolase [Phycisphaerae bacterium]